jgi:hypothetical protein
LTEFAIFRRKKDFRFAGAVLHSTLLRVPNAAVTLAAAYVLAAARLESRTKAVNATTTAGVTPTMPKKCVLKATAKMPKRAVIQTAAETAR